MEDVIVIHGDCRDVLPSLDFTVILSDPPYGINFVKGNTGKPPKGRDHCRRNADAILGDAEPFDPSHLFRWPCILFGADHYRERLPPGGAFHAWDKLAGSSLNDSFSDVEFIWTSRPGKSRIITHLWKGILRDSDRTSRKYHVSQKPVPVMTRLIDWFTGPDDVICDPYAGSGSTGVACLKAGRRCILIEKDARYLPIIQRRLVSAATPLFAK